MPLHDWIAQYPGVQALLQQPDDCLDYMVDEGQRGQLDGLSASALLVGLMPMWVVEILARACWCAPAACTVEQTSVGAVTVSTVFCGLDDDWNLAGSPLVFQTFVVGREQPIGALARYGTWNEAAAGHAQIVAWGRTDDATPA
jgi:hypothetical protein